MSVRQDHDLAFMLRYENVAWFDGACVRILDRRVYPYEKKFVYCRQVSEVAQAIRDMVTQSLGPYFAAAMGMVLAVKQAISQGEKGQDLIRFCEDAVVRLSTARPTTSARMRAVTTESLQQIRLANAAGQDPQQAAFDFALAYYERRYREIRTMGRYLVKLFPQQGLVMTQCFAETIVGMMLAACRESRKDICFICPETRPYLQGARLTASVIRDMDFPVRVITDNMPAWIMQREKVDVFTSAADVITRDGHIINKIGTFQIALAAHHLGIPFYCTGTPNPHHPDASSVTIEERDPRQVTHIFDRRVVMEGVGALYPAFDITPPHLCAAVVTADGVYSPYDLETYFSQIERNAL